MATDSNKPLPGQSRLDWNLPEVVDIKIRRVRFQPHQHKHFRSALADYGEAIEFLVQVSGPIPARALGPALFVGDVPVIESEPVDEYVLRFLAFNVEGLKSDAAIAWGWTDMPKKERRRTKFRYRAPD
jgi:hypothetical protein